MLTVLLLSVYAVSYPQKTGSWGDQGNGTYINPVINAAYPDTDIEKFGDTWYMISSTTTYAPGMTILESKDLVNWKITGHIVNRLTWDAAYNADNMSGENGVWAGDLAYHDGLWYCYFIDRRNGLFVCTAKDIKGTWSAPYLIMKKENWDDPSVFWDEESKQAYLICNYDFAKGTNPKDKIRENRLFKMSWDGMQLLDTGTVVYTGNLAEAAKIYKINEYWYFFFSEWITAEHTGRDRKQLAVRSKNIYGPYEKKIVLEKRNKDDRSACQGSLLQGNDKRWWYMHQWVQNKNSFEGRPQLLQPVSWKDNWPVIGEDKDGNGIGNIVETAVQKPVNGYAITAPQTDDEYNTDILSPQWNFNYNPDNSKWSITEREGYLRLKATVPLTNDFLKTPNILSQRKMGKGNDTIVVKMDIAKMETGQEAGLSLFADYYFNAAVRQTENKRQLLFDANGQTIVANDLNSNLIWLKCIISKNKCRYEYSTDGKLFTPFGNPFEIKPSGHEGARIGLYSKNNAGKGYVDIDWFQYEYDGPKEKIIPVNDLAEQNYFLFSYFYGGQRQNEGLHLAISKDGLRWTPVKNDSVLFHPGFGTRFRDPSLVRDPNRPEIVYMVWTTETNDAFGFASTKDFIRWENIGEIAINKNVPGVFNTWAPELIWDEEGKRWMIYYASSVKGRFPETAALANNPKANNRMYYAFSKDLVHWSQPELLADFGFPSNDNYIMKLSQHHPKGRYINFVKHIEKPGQRAYIRIAYADSIQGPYKLTDEYVTQKYMFCEGPNVFLIDGNYYLNMDLSREHRMAIFRTTQPGITEWEDMTDKSVFPKEAKHGSVINISKQLFEQLQKL